MLKRLMWGATAALATIWAAVPAHAGPESADARPETRHYFYMASPDGAQKVGRSGTGLLVFDIDDGHRFVKRINIPSMAGGVRGINANAGTHRLYYSTTRKLLGCLDLETDTILWEKTYDTGCDQGGLTPDGRKLYMPSGWWSKDTLWMVIDAMTGEEIRRIDVRQRTHNTIAGPLGTRAYLAGQDEFTVVDTKTDGVVFSVSPAGEGFYPFTVNGAETLAFISLYKAVGFEVCDLRQGKIIHRVLADGVEMKRRTHGAGLTVDEKELWISDQSAKKLWVFDATVMPPKQKTSIDLSTGGHGWVTFSLDGRYAYCHSPDIIDVKTKKIVSTFKDENGKTFASSKFIEIDFEGGRVVRTGDRFGIGRVPPEK